MQPSSGRHYIPITYRNGTHPPSQPGKNTKEREQLGATVLILTAD
jgi:hypothetical protein